MSSALAIELADCLDGSDDTTLGATDGALCAKALRAYARRKLRRVRAFQGCAIAALAAVLLSPTAYALMDLDGDGEVDKHDAHLALNYITEGTLTGRRLVTFNGQKIIVELGPTSAPGVAYAMKAINANLNISTANTGAEADLIQ